MPISLIIHGYPQPITKDHFLYDFFEQNGWEVLAPYLFTDKFIFTPENVKKYLENELGGRKPDVIVGVSLGGLIAPLIAQSYPDSKLILIATGFHFKPRSKIIEFFYKAMANKKLLGLAHKSIGSMPKQILSSFYAFLSRPYTKDASTREIYRQDSQKNIELILKIPINKDEEIIDSALKIDNRQLLKTIKNKTLIFAGKKDILMPLGLSQELKALLTNSQLIITPGRHFNPITKDNIINLKTFLA